MGETISKVLYPNDETESGKELRLVQQYFFVSCSLQDLIRRFRREHNDWNVFPKKVIIQLNDTHPAVAVLELLRFFSMKKACRGRNRGFSFVIPLHIPTIPYYRKHLKHGAKVFLEKCCRGIFSWCRK